MVLFVTPNWARSTGIDNPQLTVPIKGTMEVGSVSQAVSSFVTVACNQSRPDQSRPDQVGRRWQCQTYPIELLVP